MSKIAVIGAGFVGETVAISLVKDEIVDEVVLVDILEDMPVGKGLDMKESTPINGSDTHVWGSNDFSAISGADIVVVAAGIPRKPGMDRMDLLKTNINICKSYVQINSIFFSSFVIVCFTTISTTKSTRNQARNYY